MGNSYVVGCEKSNFSGIVSTDPKFKYVEERIGGAEAKTVDPNNSFEKFCCEGQ